MPEDIVSVILEINNQTLREEMEIAISSLEGCWLKRPEDPGSPDVIILELEEDHKKTFNRVESILASDPFTEVFLTAPRTEPEVLIQALRTGIKEFISQPVKREEVEATFKIFRERRAKRPKGEKQGEIISVIASKGGIGATTIAVNLAVSLAEQAEKKSVALVDLNRGFGDAALLLDVASLHNLGEIAKNIARLDPNFLMGSLSKHPSGVYLLPAPSKREDIGLVTPPSVEKTLSMMQVMFDFVIIDGGHSFDDVSVRALDMSNLIFLVSVLDVPGLANTRRCLDLFSGFGYPKDAIRLIINRYIKDSEIPLNKAEATLDHNSYWLIPNDYRSTITAANQGKPLSVVAPQAEITKSFQQLACKLMGKEYKEKKEASFLARLLRTG